MSNSRSVISSEITYLRVLIPFVIGIICCSRLFSIDILVWILLCGIVTALLLLSNVFFRKWKIYRHRMTTSICIHISFYLLGGMLTAIHAENLSPLHFANRSSSYLQVAIDEEPQLKKKVVMFKAKVLKIYQSKEKEPVIGHLMVTVAADSTHAIELKYGDILLLSSSFQAVEKSRNPATFDYKIWLSNKQIYHQLYLKPSQVERINSDKGNPIVNCLINIRIYK